MKTKTFFSVIILSFWVLLVSCSKKEKVLPLDFSALNGNNFVLKTDRISLSPSVQFPHDSLAESNYTHTNEGPFFDITFPGNGQTITINPGPVNGDKIRETNGSRYYDITGGLSGGGRFIIWIENNNFHAEYTIYGSGVPIIKSHRGKLEPL